MFIIGDDISSEDIGCFGNPGIRTPNIDRLAAESRVFDNAYVTASSCSPSRCSIITSRYPHNLETAAELHRALPEGVALFPKVLREAGYFTALAGKSHFGEGGEHPTGPAKAAFEVSSGAVQRDYIVRTGAPGARARREHGVSVASICEELIFPELKTPQVAQEYDALCRQSGARK